MSKTEITGLLASGAERLTDARNPALALSSRFDLAYNAAHAFSLAALRWYGFRSESRYIVFQALIHTVGIPPATYRILSKAHGLRNAAEYEGHCEVEETFLASLIAATEEVRIGVVALTAGR